MKREIQVLKTNTEIKYSFYKANNINNGIKVTNEVI